MSAPAIAILGKAQGTKPENLQLRARIAMAAALWHAAGAERPSILYVAAHDAGQVASVLRGSYGVPDRHVLTRRVSNCTFREVRAIESLRRAHGLGTLVAITHGYHVPRTRRYLAEITDDFRVVAAEPGAAADLLVPAAGAEGVEGLEQVLRAAVPGTADGVREWLVERTLDVLHAVDRSGRIECALADRVRIPGVDA